MDSTGMFLMGVLISYSSYRLIDRMLKIIEYNIKRKEEEKEIVKMLDREDYLE